jgi:hypothetical protein
MNKCDSNWLLTQLNKILVNKLNEQENKITKSLKKQKKI